MKSLTEQVKLSEDKFLEILSDVIKKYTNQVSSVEQPTAVILGAQPGAGKTWLQRESETLFFDNIVICNADLLRDSHPMAEEIKTKHEADYPELTAYYSQRWNDELCRYCRAHKLNYIMETTFSSGERLNQTIVNIKKEGYKVEIMLMAVHPLISLLGTYVRYETEKNRSDYARMVSPEAHDSRFDKLMDTIKLVETAKLYDSISVYARSIAVEGSHSDRGVRLIAKNPAKISPLFLDFIDRKNWPKKLEVFFKNSIDEVLQLMRKRKASKKEVAAFRISMGIKTMKRG